MLPPAVCLAYDLVAHPVFIIERDASGIRLGYANPSTTELLGSLQPDAPFPRLVDYFPGRTGTLLAEMGQSILSGEQQAHRFEQRIPIGEKLCLVSIQLRSDPSSDGAKWVVGTLTDLSDQCVMRGALNNRHSSHDDTEDFIHLAAHDLRKPMQQVAQAADRLRDGFQDLGDGKIEMIDRLETIGKNALELIGDVLAHAEARIAGGPSQAFDFGQLIDEVMAVLDPLQTVIVERDDCQIHADKAVLQCVVRNLIDNSMRHAKPDDDRLHLRLRIENVSEEYFRLVFEDNGTDFDPELMFSPTRILVQDAGFGMLGVRRIVFAQGGTILSSSAPNGSGAHFAVALPGRRKPIIQDIPRLT